MPRGDGLYERARAAGARLAGLLGGRRPRTGFVLGSALGGFAGAVEEAVSVPYADLPHMPRPTAAGHAGLVVAGLVGGLEVVVLSGRPHYYEGLAPEEVTFPVRLLAALGVETLVLTNAAGGVDPSFAAGDLMAIEDQINLTGMSPLRGPNDDRLGPRFPDMTDLYDPALRERLAEAAAGAGVALRRGVYAGVAGPAYETPAEVRMLGALGAHAVGMSTVAEAIVARHAGMRLAGVSCITNPAAGLAGPLSHDEVMETARASASAMTALLTGFCRATAAAALRERAGEEAADTRG